MLGAVVVVVVVIQVRRPVTCSRVNLDKRSRQDLIIFKYTQMVNKYPIYDYDL